MTRPHVWVVEVLVDGEWLCGGFACKSEQDAEMLLRHASSKGTYRVRKYVRASDD